ncbi:MAG: Phosphate:acyl-ACP acyltransferase PlsX [Candidatus Carbobacillus altaicus]|uniref:Phosphate:acyl-ACP acyltransferase PlsX n=1 Tax=Candidatus Carbonibacillus altaicus TaxID=2163959 RepID=A0A2R6Y5G2_9BACL|nr:MAG: Phosphate:acyl-ACP acyltransferase PlsX [Candidatus Carbobacillus altaicus]
MDEVKRLRSKRKEKRQEALKRVLLEDPFLTDAELAARFGVSVQTIRLDRMTLGIPEVRERLKDVAVRHFDRLRALEEQDLIGEVEALKRDEYARSVLRIQPEHVFTRSRIARGHVLFAQANSLAIAVTDADWALTASALLQFVTPVELGQTVVMEATVRLKAGTRREIVIKGTVAARTVLEGVWTVVLMAHEDALRKKHATGARYKA